MEAGALLPNFLPPSGPRQTHSSKDHTHLPCRLRGLLMAGRGGLPGPLVLACGEGTPLHCL